MERKWNGSGTSLEDRSQTITSTFEGDYCSGRDLCAGNTFRADGDIYINSGNGKRDANHIMPSSDAASLLQNLSLQVPEPHAGHSYGSTTVNDNAHAHFGDINHVHYHLEPSQEDRYATLHKSLAFERMLARHRNVEKALPSTCQWLFSHQHFVAWENRNKTDDHHGLLWIKGKPGSGKSTIMKEALVWVEKEWPTKIVLSYFFNARATGQLEKSSLGLYRSLLHQLLSIVPAIRPLFLSTYSPKARERRVGDWSEKELQNFFVEIVTLTPTILPAVNILIDALDEGQDDDVRPMLDFIDQLGQHATSSGVQLRICLSSRYYPNITIHTGLFIFLEKESEHTHDIERYVTAKFRGIRGSQIDMLREEVLRRSAGVFLWVVLVVQMLKKMCDQGKRPGVILKKLGSIPQDLHNLFANLVKPDDEDFEECITLFQWVMFSLEPLEPIELYLAIQQAHAPSEMDEARFMDQATAMNYILNCSRGLVEFSSDWNDRLASERLEVQFIHETVRDYLKAGEVLSHRTLNEQGSLSLSLTETCDMVIAETCLRYLLHVCEASSLAADDDNDEKHYLLLYYARNYWWKYLQRSHRACTERVSQLAFTILTLKDARLHSLLLQKYASLPVSPLSYASSIGVPKLVLTVLSHTADVNAQGGFYGNALQTASGNGHVEVVQLLLERGAVVNARGGEYDYALTTAAGNGFDKVVRVLLEYGADANLPGQKALLWAAGGGYVKVAEILLDAGADIDFQEEDSQEEDSGPQGSALSWALDCGQEGVARLLLDKGACPDYLPKGDLYRAAYLEQIEIVQLILERGAGVIPQESYNEALAAAFVCDRGKLAEMLLKAGADANALDSEGNMYGRASMYLW
ncbi:hypothetical protein LTR70_006959 [Exophiala xenobiotica]|uniref:Nephrocystin 3-like N-terminal domain-containing protein n=1 Tax=Lithohypha guttulata TaxID=1690604 RepID=A0ABR0K5F4_9EURO|nr:hypothetical protein LTR24_006587 [Lithohypha guttulata]KAK5314918.1 hypothetical protein LTR70_006959 [Exophiala xenobiotica]